MKKLILSVCFALSTLLPSHAFCANSTRHGLSKDTICLADPTIFKDHGIYYLYGTGSADGIWVYQSPDLKNWTGPVGKRNGHALLRGDSYGTKGFWAPQVFKRNGRYYMAYTADEHIAIAESDSPLGPFVQKIFKSISGAGSK